MSDEFHPAVDEYLETIGWLLEEGAPVIRARLAERLGRSKPSVSEMLERLQASGYVERSGRQIVLTDEGSVRSLAVIRRHRLAERLLVDVIGLPWRELHAEARRFQRVISAEVADRLVELLDDPATCPHGNPIPGSGRRAADPDAFRLAEATGGQNLRLVRMTPEIEVDGASVAYLDDGGFVPGAVAVVRERGPDGTFVISLAGRYLALGPYLCGRLFVVAE